MYGDNIRNVRAWTSREELLFGAPSNGGKCGNVRMPDFPHCEDSLYLEFLHRREVLGMRVDGRWLQVQMLVLVQENCPDHPKASTFVASQGWVTNWKKRYRVTNKCKTNNQPTTVAERLPTIRKFHRHLQEEVFQRGQVLPRQVFYMDQVPNPYVQPQAYKRSLNSIGRMCAIKLPFKSAYKRIMTLQITECAEVEEPQPVLLSCLLRGTGMRPSAEEKALWDSMVKSCL